MSNSRDFANNLFLFMEETFEAKHHGIYLDDGTSLFETLESVSADEASIPVEANAPRSRRRLRM
jgi:hypothetical protein